MFEITRKEPLLSYVPETSRSLSDLIPYRTKVTSLELASTNAPRENLAAIAVGALNEGFTDFDYSNRSTVYKRVGNQSSSETVTQSMRFRGRKG